MAMIDLDEIHKLSVEERFELLDALWNSLAEHPENLPVSDAQRAEVRRRLEDHRSNPDSGRSWDDVREDMKKA